MNDRRREPMKTIWKFPFSIDDEFVLNMPYGAVPLAVHMQNGGPCLWAEVNTRKVSFPRHFSIVGTGHPMPEGKHIATFQNPPFVWHLYEIAPNHE